MTTTNERTAEESNNQSIEAMGEPLGELYSALWQQLTLLYYKWGDYIALYGTDENRIDLLNKTGSNFFRTIQDCLWEDKLLHLTRITDSSRSAGKDNLSIQRFSKLVIDPIQRAKLDVLVESAIKATAFARDWRNRRIAHRDLLLALNQPTEPLAIASRKHVTDALSAIGQVLNFISNTYMESTTMFEFASEQKAGGALTTLYYLHAGLEAEEERRDRIKSGTFSTKDINHKGI